MRAMDAKHYLVEIALLRDRVPSFEDYPFNLPVVRHLDTLEFHPKVTFLVGENATGKSTLLEAIAVAFGINPEGGGRNFTFETFASHSALHECIRVVKGIRSPKDSFFLRSESFYNLASEVHRLDAEASFSAPVTDSYGGKALHEQSHGESFFAVFMHRFGGAGLYLLDEPEAALSPMRQMALLSIIYDLTQRGAQFVIATHSPIIMAYPDAWIYGLSEDGIERVDYSDTEHYKITRQFLNNPQKMLKILLQD